MKPKKTENPMDMPTPCKLPCDALTPRPGNRDLSHDPEVTELAESLAVIGQLSSIHVRPLEVGRYEIIAGVRRWQAAQLAGWKEIRAVIHEKCDDVRAEQIRLTENVHRREATALDTARGLQRIKNLNMYTHEQLAEATGLPLMRIRLYLSVFAASDAVLKVIETHDLSLSLAAELMRYEKAFGELAVRPLLREAAAGNLSVRDVQVLRKRRDQPSNTKRQEHKSGGQSWEAIAKRLERYCLLDPEVLSHLEAFCARLRTSSATTLPSTEAASTKGE